MSRRLSGGLPLSTDNYGVLMVGEGIGSGADLPAGKRAELERAAFAKPTSDADARAAADALRQLAAADADAAARAIPEAPATDAEPLVAEQPGEAQGEPPGAATDEADGDSTGDHDADDHTTPRRRDRSVIPLLVVIGLVIGLGLGFLLARGTATGALGDSTADPTAPATTAPETTAAARRTAALLELDSPQTATDVFPLPSFSTTLGIEPKSVHRIMTTSDGLTLWTGKSAEDICLLFTGADANSLSDAGSTCATQAEFGITGLQLFAGGNEWAWNGETFTLTTAP